MESNSQTKMAAKPRLALWIATGAGLGLAPKAPGTFGSVGGVVFALALQRILNGSGLVAGAAGAVSILVLAIGTWIAIGAIRKAEEYWGTHDDQRIVIDEVLGQAIPLCVLPIHQFWQIFLSFLLFRVLDITKPGPIGWADRLPGPWGTLLDDLVAGGLAALVMWPLLSYF
jgi:phosphatidylglycerophosphatase A